MPVCLLERETETESDRDYEAWLIQFWRLISLTSDAVGPGSRGGCWPRSDVWKQGADFPGSREFVFWCVQAEVPLLSLSFPPGSSMDRAMLASSGESGPSPLILQCQRLSFSGNVHRHTLERTPHHLLVQGVNRHCFSGGL